MPDPDLDIGSVPVPLQPITPAPDQPPALSDPCTVKSLIQKPLKGEKKKKVTMDDINEMHFEVLYKESWKLDLEIENLMLKKREISLRIEEISLRSWKQKRTAT